MTEKRTIKNPIKFKVQLSEEQKDGKRSILDNKISIIEGKAGSGKSLLAANVALDLLFTHGIGKIVITRPTVTAGEELGFMPGNIDDKLAPYTSGIFANMEVLVGQEKFASIIKEHQIEIVPIGFMRGRNFSDVCVVVEEAQNVTHEQMQLIFTRLCKGSKMILTGDADQIDLKIKGSSGFPFICESLSEVDGITLIRLKQNHRDPIVEEILNIYKNK